MLYMYLLSFWYILIIYCNPNSTWMRRTSQNVKIQCVMALMPSQKTARRPVWRNVWLRSFSRGASGSWLVKEVQTWASDHPRNASSRQPGMLEKYADQWWSMNRSLDLLEIWKILEDLLIQHYQLLFLLLNVLASIFFRFLHAVL